MPSHAAVYAPGRSACPAPCIERVLLLGPPVGRGVGAYGAGAKTAGPDESLLQDPQRTACVLVTRSPRDRLAQGGDDGRRVACDVVNRDGVLADPQVRTGRLCVPQQVPD